MQTRTFGMAAIVGLLAWSSPPAVARLVVPVVIDSIDFESRRAWSYVSEKHLETNTPLWTHSDSTPSIVLKGLSAWIEAAVFSVIPGLIFAALLAVTCLSVRCASSSSELPIYTTTAFCGELTSQYGASNDRSISAVAAAEPLSLTVYRAGRAFKHEQTTKALSRQGDDVIRHEDIFNTERRGCQQKEHLWA